MVTKTVILGKMRNVREYQKHKNNNRNNKYNKKGQNNKFTTIQNYKLEKLLR